MRINRALAMLGFGSRRSVEELVTAGRVKVNGQTVTELATVVDPLRDQITVDGKTAQATRRIQLLAFHKPRGVLCTWSDERGRRCLADYFPARGKERVFAVGRLDRDSEGLLLITNDGELAHALMHPSSEAPRTYEVAVSPPPDERSITRLGGRTVLEDGPIRPDGVKLVRRDERAAVLSISLHEGRNRIMRRLLAAHGFEVLRLRRTAYGGVQLGRLKPGESRDLSAVEAARLRRAVGR